MKSPIKSLEVVYRYPSAPYLASWTIVGPYRGIQKAMPKYLTIEEKINNYDKRMQLRRLYYRVYMREYLKKYRKSKQWLAYDRMCKKYRYWRKKAELNHLDT